MRAADAGDGCVPQLERVERLGEEAWAGVAAIDRGEENGPNAGYALVASTHACAMQDLPHVLLHYNTHDRDAGGYLCWLEVMQQRFFCSQPSGGQIMARAWTLPPCCQLPGLSSLVCALWSPS